MGADGCCGLRKVNTSKKIVNEATNPKVKKGSNINQHQRVASGGQQKIEKAQILVANYGLKQINMFDKSDEKSPFQRQNYQVAFSTFSEGPKTQDQMRLPNPKLQSAQPEPLTPQKRVIVRSKELQPQEQMNYELDEEGGVAQNPMIFTFHYRTELQHDHLYKNRQQSILLWQSSTKMVRKKQEYN